MSNNPVRLQSGDGIPITQTSKALDVNIKSGSSGLPTGAATSAKQDTGNSSLTSIDGKLSSLGTITPATATGTCTAAYVVALSLSCVNVSKKTIIVVNTDAALTMKYRIRGYAKSGSSYYNEIQAEATLAASTSQPHVIENYYDLITVEVIDGSGHATYAIDYAGGQ
jgi:hypothetical protein